MTILCADVLLKRDHYAGLLALDRSPVEGAPNLRRVPTRRGAAPLFGLAQPTLDGLRHALHWMGLAPGQGSCMWVNLRAETVIYIDGEPYNLRRVSAPLENVVIYPDPMESAARLKEELLRCETVRLWSESVEGRVFHRDVTPRQVHTVADVFAAIRAEGYDVTLHRVPVLDERRPEAGAIDRISALLQGMQSPRLVMNCHAGHGRTTTGLVLASIVEDAMRRDRLQLHRHPTVHAHVRELMGPADAAQYRLLLDLVRSMQGGFAIWREAERAVARCASPVNLRKLATERIADVTRAHAFFERYLLIIIFQAWVEQCVVTGLVPSFSEWLRQHPHYAELLGAD